VLCLASRAWSQVAGSATLTSNYLYRGVSLSDGLPALDLALVYDAKSGLYLGGSLIGEVTRREGAEILGHQEYLGYALRLNPRSTVDFGVSNLNYRSYVYPYGGADATEVYLGWVTGPLNYYLHYSPNYFRPGARTLYGEVNGTIRLPRRWRLFGHVGVLTPLGGAYEEKERYDVRAGVAVAVKRLEAQLAWATSRPDPPYAAYIGTQARGRGVVALQLSWFF
jgi:uncharacterized protein (TIGR02001 family)